MRIIIVPDVHGRPFWRKVLTNKEDTIVFLGDYSDPYEFVEGYTHEEAIYELTDIVQFKKENRERVILLLGNHDAGYIDYKFISCRYSVKLYNEYHRLFTEDPNLFQMAYSITINDIDYLFTHAGVSPKWLSGHHLAFTADALNKAWLEKPNVFNEVGLMRGGKYMVGSPIWIDAEEHDSVSPYVQIFGHTQQEENPYINWNMWCLDCRKVFILEDGKIEEYKEQSWNVRL